MERNQAAQIGGWCSIIVNTLLFILKYWAGVLSGSLALVADAWHTLSDSITSVIVLISSRMSAKPADREHPFGHGRAEVIASLVIGVLLGVVSIEFFRESFFRFHMRQGARFGLTAVIVTAVSILLKEGLAQYAIITGKKYKLLNLEADGRHHRSDALSSLAVLIGILLSRKFWWMDSLLSLVIAVIIGVAAMEILLRSVGVLLGRKAEEDLINKVKQICTEESVSAGVDLTPHHFHEHRYGQHTELTFHVLVPGEWSISQGHKLIDGIEELLRRKHNIEATIHIEPRGEENAAETE